MPIRPTQDNICTLLGGFLGLITAVVMIHFKKQQKNAVAHLPTEELHHAQREINSQFEILRNLINIAGMLMLLVPVAYVAYRHKGRIEEAKRIFHTEQNPHSDAWEEIQNKFKDYALKKKDFQSQEICFFKKYIIQHLKLDASIKPYLEKLHRNEALTEQEFNLLFGSFKEGFEDPVSLSLLTDPARIPGNNMLFNHSTLILANDGIHPINRSIKFTPEEIVRDREKEAQIEEFFNEYTKVIKVIKRENAQTDNALTFRGHQGRQSDLENTLSNSS